MLFLSLHWKFLKKQASFETIFKQGESKQISQSEVNKRAIKSLAFLEVAEWLVASRGTATAQEVLVLLVEGLHDLDHLYQPSLCFNEILAAPGHRQGLIVLLLEVSLGHQLGIRDGNVVIRLPLELESQSQDLFSQLLDFIAVFAVFTEKVVVFTLGRSIWFLVLLIEGRRV